MSYLRTNYRITGKELDADAVGGGVVLGSWGGGAGTNRAFGGFIMGSYNGAAYATYHVISAYGAMSQYYGSGQFDSGYKIFPFAVWDASVNLTGDVSVNYKYLWSASGSLIIIKGLKFSEILDSVSGTAGVEATVVKRHVASAFASGESIHFVWAGWIVSAP